MIDFIIFVFIFFFGYSIFVNFVGVYKILGLLRIFKFILIFMCVVILGFKDGSMFYV